MFQLWWLLLAVTSVVLGAWGISAERRYARVLAERKANLLLYQNLAQMWYEDIRHLKATVALILATFLGVIFLALVASYILT